MRLSLLQTPRQAVGLKSIFRQLTAQLEERGIKTEYCTHRSKASTPSSYIIQSRATGSRTIVSCSMFVVKHVSCMLYVISNTMQDPGSYVGWFQEKDRDYQYYKNDVSQLRKKRSIQLDSLWRKERRQCSSANWLDRCQGDKRRMAIETSYISWTRKTRQRKHWCIDAKGRKEDILVYVIDHITHTRSTTGWCCLLFKVICRTSRIQRSKGIPVFGTKQMQAKVK